MSKPARLRLADLRAIHYLTHECRDLGDDNGTWQRHFLEGLARIVSADVAVGGELRDLAAGMPRGVHPGDTTTDWGFENGFDRRGWERALYLLEHDPTYSPMLTRHSRRHRRQPGVALRRTELISDAEWDRSVERDEVYRVSGINHNVGCFHVIPGTVDEVYGSYLLRADGRCDFTERERLVVQQGFAALVPLVGRSLARITEPSPAALPPRVRQVLRCLLEGDGDKQIAVRLGLSPHTVNQYVKAIYAHFGVTTRAELLARWVKRGWGARCAWADG